MEGSRQGPTWMLKMVRTPLSPRNCQATTKIGQRQLKDCGQHMGQEDQKGSADIEGRDGSDPATNKGNKYQPNKGQCGTCGLLRVESSLVVELNAHQ